MVQSTVEPTAKKILRASTGTKKISTSTKSDIFYCPSGVGHVGLYTDSSHIIEAPGIGREVRIWACSDKSVEIGTKIAGVSNTVDGKTRISEANKTSVVNWAKTRIGASYAYTLDNKHCSKDIDYNCSQLVWCSFKQGINKNIDNSSDGFVTPSDIYHSHYVFYVKTVS